MPSTRQATFAEIRVQLRLSIIAIAGVIVFGVLGYIVVEGWSFLDSLYMTVITLAGVGFSETNPLDTSGRILTIALIGAGLTTLGNFIGQVTRAFAEGYFQDLFDTSRRTTMLAKLENHFIICGYGRIGQQVCRDFKADNQPFVVIETEDEQVRRAEQQGVLVLQGDASSDELLLAAGIERAKCILCALPSDAENLYIVLSAKLLNPKILVIARASTEEGAAKLARVGADRVVSPYLTGAKRMAALAVRPQVVDFMEAALVGKDNTFYIEELVLERSAGCPAIGQSLKQLDLRAKSGSLILAIRRSGGELIGGPTADTMIEEGDLLICMGTKEQLQLVGELLLPSKRLNR